MCMSYSFNNYCLIYLQTYHPVCYEDAQEVSCISVLDK